MTSRSSSKPWCSPRPLFSANEPSHFFNAGSPSIPPPPLFLFCFYERWEATLGCGLSTLERKGSHAITSRYGAFRFLGSGRLRRFGGQVEKAPEGPKSYPDFTSKAPLLMDVRSRRDLGDNGKMRHQWKVDAKTLAYIIIVLVLSTEL